MSSYYDWTEPSGLRIIFKPLLIPTRSIQIQNDPKNLLGSRSDCLDMFMFCHAPNKPLGPCACQAPALSSVKHQLAWSLAKQGVLIRMATEILQPMLQTG